jgi:hypothetical protein
MTWSTLSDCEKYDRSKLVLLVLITIILIWVLYTLICKTEDFINRKELAEEIVQKTESGFNSDSMNYDKFKTSIGRDSNAVLYTDVKQLHKSDKFTVPDIMTVI